MVAVNSVDLTVGEGELFVLLGPSGSGKSTTLRLIAGLETPSSGTIHLNGRQIEKLACSDREISMVFQSPALYPHMSVGENLAFGLKLRHTPSSERAERIASVAGLLGIGELLARSPETLSGGEQQRVSLARGLVTRPKLFLLDEPFSNLDAPARADFRRELRRLQQGLGIPMLYVTHDQSEAMALGDRIGVLRAGRVEQAGTPEELYLEPSNVFIAGFFGSPPMNLIPAAITEDGCGVVLNGTTNCLLIEQKAASSALRQRAKREVIIGIRGENIRLSEGPSGVGAAVIWIENHGWESWVGCKSGPTEMTLRTITKPLPNLGSAVRLDFEASRMIFFDPVTGNRIS